MLITLKTAVIFHLKVADKTPWKNVINFSHFSAITQRPQAGWTQGLRAKRLSARRSVSICVCASLHFCPSSAHPLSLPSPHTKINDKPSWSHLVFLSRLHLIPCFLCLSTLVLYSPVLSSHLFFNVRYHSKHSLLYLRSLDFSLFKLSNL